MKLASTLAARSDESLQSIWLDATPASACCSLLTLQRGTARTSGNCRDSRRHGATIIAVLVVLLIVSLLAHQTARTLFVIRQGQDQRAKIIQAREVLELGRIMGLQLRSTPSLLTAQPMIVKVGDEYAKLEFSSESTPESEDLSKAITESTPNEDTSVNSLPDRDGSTERPPIHRIVATWPVDSNGIELPRQLPTKVSWEKTR